MEKDILIGENERLDDLEFNGLMIIQRPDLYCFTSDAVLLANSVKVPRGGIACDIGTGSGIMAIIIAAKTACSKVYGVEIQSVMSDMARRSAEYNGLSDKIEIINADIKDRPLPAGCCDTVVCNPPFYKTGTGGERLKPEIALSRHEIAATLEDILSCASYTLKYGGRMYMIHKCERLADAICGMRAVGLEPKELCFVYPKRDKAPDTCIVTAKKGAMPSLSVKSLTVYNDDGTMTAQAKKMYGKE